MNAACGVRLESTAFSIQGAPKRHFETLLGFDSFVIRLAALPPVEQR